MLAAPFEKCQELATATHFLPRGGPQRIAPHARSRCDYEGHPARMARLEIGALRCGPPFTSGVLGARCPGVRRRGTPSDMHGMGKSDPWVDRSMREGTARGAAPCTRRAVRDRAPGPRRARFARWAARGEARGGLRSKPDPWPAGAGPAPRTPDNSPAGAVMLRRARRDPRLG